LVIFYELKTIVRIKKSEHLKVKKKKKKNTLMGMGHMAQKKKKKILFGYGQKILK
jgi:hypothetical protein